MTMERHRGIEPPRGPGRFAAFAAALAAAMLLGGAPAAAEPTATGLEKDAPPGVQIEISPDEAFDDAGTNPRFTRVQFPARSEYFVSSQTGVRQGGRLLSVTVKAEGDLNALASPPPSPFKSVFDVSMRNDEGGWAKGTITLETTYNRTSGPVSAPSTPRPVLDSSQYGESNPQSAPVGVLVSALVDEVFDNAGTNPRFTEAVFSTTEYYDTGRIGSGGARVFVKAKTAEDLNALPSPPPTPFEVTVDVTMTNDEGQTATATLVFETAYIRNE